MNILLVQNPAKPGAKELASWICTFLKAKGIHPFAPQSDAHELKLRPYEQNSPIDTIISLGGDGSILKIVHEFPELDAPIMGINLGTLGFLADIGTGAVTNALERLLKGDYIVQSRLMLEGKQEGQKPLYAVNEVVAHRGKNHTIVDFALFVDNRYLNTFSADGVIIATPSGSTAYSLSAGGPILTPDLDCVVITPICPHAVSNRSIVLKATQAIQIKYSSEHDPIEISSDGIMRFCLKQNEPFTISASKKRFQLITLKEHDYFETLRTKLGWTGSLKP